MSLKPKHPDILLLIGTQTGNSESVADVVAETLGSNGFVVHIVDMAEAYPEMLTDYRQLVVVMCTWAEGTFPDNAVAFFEAYQSVEMDLSMLSYAMVGLGDHDYDPYFLTANIELAKALEGQGATRTLEMLEIDGTPQARHLEGVEEWAATLAGVFAT